MIDNNTIEQARHTDLLQFLERHNGFTFSEKSGIYRCRQHPSLAIKNDRLSFYWHSKGIGGYGAVDYLMKIENMGFRDALEVIRGWCFTTSLTSQQNRPTPSAPPTQSSLPKNLTLPERAGVTLQLFDYLCIKRGIDSTIIHRLMDENKLYQDRRGNIVFVGYDEQGKVKFASLRGTYDNKPFRRDCTGSDKRYCFHMTYSQSVQLYIFESAIDSMSHASIENVITGNASAWLEHNRLSLSGTADTALPKYLQQHPHVKELVLCMDNDTAGRDAAIAIARKYADKGYMTRLELPRGKDYNEDLLVAKKAIISATKLPYTFNVQADRGRFYR